MNRKGAIELSANFIIVIIISMVILASGVGLFFKLKNNAQQYVDTLDSQTEDKLKSMMLSNNYKVAVYPQDAKISTNDAALVGVGIKNNYPMEKTFTLAVKSVKKYTDAKPEGIAVTNLPSFYSITNPPTLKIGPNTQAVKGVLLKMPDSEEGEYVYTIEVTVAGESIPYGVVQVYVQN
ncbi:MAG TPA: hypothetical protein VEC16_02145 [Alphaproteobacteria bacterium]|nr:hypothetical protein [Alphaproteobacteria bacterium]